jgi:hypothetical protein
LFPAPANQGRKRLVNMKIRSFGEKRPGGQWNGVGDGGSNADAREGESVLCRERETGEGESLERETGEGESLERERQGRERV